MPKNTVVNLDPIDRQKDKDLGIIGRLIITRAYLGKPIKKMPEYGHYMFCGKQGSGKTSSALWYCEFLAKKFKRKGYQIDLYSNIDIGKYLNRDNLYSTIFSFNPYVKVVRIVFIDEIQTYFPKDSTDKDTKKIKDNLVGIFSQLRKRNTFIISTSQVYGRVDKALREQCLYMIACKVNLANKLVNDFILGDDIMCDQLGRWAGKPRKIYVHGLPKTQYDTKKIISV